MNRNAIIHPVTPWYREPWPWILMAGPAFVVVAGFATMYIAFSRADPLVVDQYYKEGLAINRVLERDHAALLRGYRATIVLNEERTLVRVRMAGEMLPAELHLHFIHPTKAGLDREISARQIQPGLYQGSVQLAQAMRWNVELEDAQRQWRLTGAWNPAEDRFVLEPRS
jgi:hypothetical protein